MNKNTKLGKFLSVVLVAMLMLSLASPAFAEGETEGAPAETPIEVPAEVPVEAPVQNETVTPIPTPTPTPTPELAETLDEETPVDEASVEETADEGSLDGETPDEETLDEEVTEEGAVPEEAATVQEVAVEEQTISNTDAIGEAYTLTIATENSDWVVNGDTTSSFNDVMNNLGIEGDVVEIVGSNNELFTVEQDENGNWVFNSKQPFTSEEYIELKIEGQDEPIRLKVTDPSGSMAVDLSYGSVEAVWGNYETVPASGEYSWVFKVTYTDSVNGATTSYLNNGGDLTVQQSNSTTSSTANTVKVDTSAAESGTVPVLNVILKQVNVNSTSDAFTVVGDENNYSQVYVKLEGDNKLASTNGDSVSVKEYADVIIDDYSGDTTVGSLKAGTIDGTSSSAEKWPVIVIDGGEITAHNLATSGAAKVNYYGGTINAYNFGDETMSNVTLNTSATAEDAKTWEFAYEDGSDITNSALALLFSRLVDKNGYINTDGYFAFIPSYLTVVDNYGDIGDNFGTVENNYEYIDYNFGNIGTNYGRVSDNFKYMEYNKGLVEYNGDNGVIWHNAQNDDYRYVIKDLFSGQYFRAGVIAVNGGYVNTNTSTIFDNFGKVDLNLCKWGGRILRSHPGATPTTKTKDTTTYVTLKVDGKTVECKNYTIGADYRVVLDKSYDKAEMEITNLSTLYNAGIRTITIVNGDGSTYTITLDSTIVASGKIVVTITATDITAKAGTTSLKVEKDKDKAATTTK